MNFTVGDRFEGRYEIRAELHRNDRHVSYQATAETGHDVVVRLLLAQPGYPPGFEARFMSEAKHVAKLRHAGTARLESFGASAQGVLYLVTEYIAGKQLSAIDLPVTAQEALALTTRLTECLEEAHARGIAHRDLAPTNIIIPAGYGLYDAKLRGFGITTTAEDEVAANPRYVAPELLTGGVIGVAANIYSLGLILFELLTGTPCAAGSTRQQLHAAHLSPAEFDLSAVPPATRPLLQRMLAKDPVYRFSTTDELLHVLHALDDTRDFPTNERPQAHRDLDTALVEAATKEQVQHPRPLDATLVEVEMDELRSDEVRRQVPEPAGRSGDAFPVRRTARRAPAQKPLPEQLPDGRVSPWLAGVVLLSSVAAALVVAKLVTHTPEHENPRPPHLRPTILQTNEPAALNVAVDPPEDVIDTEPAPQPPTNGCGQQVAPGWQEALEFAGLTETAHRVRIPAGYDGTPSPVIIATRPAQSGARQFVTNTGLDELADELNALVILPNEPSMRLAPWHDHGASIREFERVLEHASATYCIDEDHIFGVGMSGGGWALDLYACAHPDRLKGLALVASWLEHRTECDDRTARLYVNSKADPVSPYDGGVGCWNSTYRMAMVDMLAERREQLGCGEETPWLTYEDGTCSQYEGCDNTVLAHCAVEKAHHEWPGSPIGELGCPLVLPSGPRKVNFPTTEVVGTFLRSLIAPE